MQTENEKHREKTEIKVIPASETGVGPGVWAEKDGIVFSCESPEGQPSLLLYPKGEKEPAFEIPFPESAGADGIYSMKVKIPSRQMYEYNFRCSGQVVTDPYARALAGREVFGQRTGEDPHCVRGVIPQKKYDWMDDRLPQIPYEDAVMYQLHVRGFTMQKNSGVRHKGTFRGVMEKLPYIKSLGVNQIRLMPCYEFHELAEAVPMGVSAGPVQEQKEGSWKLNFWGYCGGYYFAPKASYASVPQRVTEELKDLVRACHQQQIEVILEFYFDDKADFELISRCLAYWAQEYHIDGFSVIARESVVAELVRLPLFAQRKLITSWYPGNCLEYRKNQEIKQMAESNDGFKNDCRRLLKGDDDCLALFSERMKRNPTDHAVINYMTNHDGFTMLDLVSYDRKHNEDNGQQGRDGTDYNYSWNCGVEGPTNKKNLIHLRMQQRKNAFAMMLLAQGTPMLLAGDELGNSQQGNNNPYCHDSELSWTDWSRKGANQELTAFVSALTEFRRKHRILHMTREPHCSDMRSCGYPDLSFHSSKAWYGAFEPMNRHLGCMYDEEYAGSRGFLYIAYNFHWEDHQFALPFLPKDLCWRKVMDTSKKESFIAADEQIIYEKEKSFQVSPRTVVILETCERKSSLSEEGQKAADLGKNKRPLHYHHRS